MRIVGAELARRVREGRPAGAAVLARLAAEAAGLGVAVAFPDWDEGLFAFQRDPYSGDDSLLARFVADTRRGTVCLRPDGTVYAEFDVLRRHPANAALWVDAIVAWGTPPRLKGEVRLLEMPRDI